MIRSNGELVEYIKESLSEQILDCRDTNPFGGIYPVQLSLHDQDDLYYRGLAPVVVFVDMVEVYFTARLDAVIFIDEDTVDLLYQVDLTSASNGHAPDGLGRGPESNNNEKEGHGRIN